MRALRRSERIDVDFLVIGHGVAGLLSAALLSSKGARVAVAGAGETATSLSTGCIGILDRRGGPSGPIGDLSAYPPYDMKSGESPESVLSSLFGFLLPRLRDQGMTMVGDTARRKLHLSCLGTDYSCSMAQEFCLPERKGEVALLGLMGYRDLDPDLAVGVMEERPSRSRARAYWMRPECFENRTDLHCQEVARMVEIGVLPEELTEAICDLPQEAVGIPPIADLRCYRRVMERLRRDSGRKVMELVTPLGLPGRRLQEAMQDMCIAEGARLLPSHLAASISIRGTEADEVLLRTKSREIPVDFGGLVLATGDLVGGGIETAAHELVDPMSIFRVRSPGGRGLESLTLSGIMTEGLHPVTKDGSTMRNVVLAGSCLSGFSYPSGVGMGGALYTSWLAARELGGW